ncbi:type I-E CRISPR-associated endoribonuclease Cas2e [Embleya sp. NPDC056575]|uniref:type I-E CRISPR-associated endoribonuclease Cas2e n=1 Tax=unclassified Embleya TaxID=2699296 RepID=UPI0036D19B99
MTSLVVLTTTAVPDHVRGGISRWMIETVPGTYVGMLSARARDEVWDLVSKSVGQGAAVLIHLAQTEQGFAIATAGERRRVPVDFDGLTLMAFNPMENRGEVEPGETAGGSWPVHSR